MGAGGRLRAAVGSMHEHPSAVCRLFVSEGSTEPHWLGLQTAVSSGAGPWEEVAAGGNREGKNAFLMSFCSLSALAA